MKDITEINKAVMSVNHAWASSDQQYSIRRQKLMNKIDVLKNVLIKFSNDNWSPNNSILDKSREFCENAVFICGYMKSGTSLLLGLLDGHPECVALPGDAHLSKWWIRNDDTSYDELKDEYLLFWIKRLIAPGGLGTPRWLMGEGYMPYLDFLNYVEFWLDNLDSSKRNLSLSAPLAYYCANPNRPENPRLWVDKTPGNEMRVDETMEYFPSARFLHIIRNPFPNIASLKQFANAKKRQWEWNTRGSAYAIKKSFKVGMRNQAKYGKQRYHILQYENLVGNTEYEIKILADFLGIDMHDNLLIPTLNGMNIRANSMYKDRQMTGVVRHNPDGWRNLMSIREQKEIVAVLYPVLKKCGYNRDIYLADYISSLPQHIVFKLSQLLKSMHLTKHF